MLIFLFVDNITAVFLTNQTIYTKLRENNKVIQFQAYDPEGMTVLFSLKNDTAEGVTMAENGLLSWSNSTMHDFETDVVLTVCDASTRMSIKLTLQGIYTSSNL